MAPQFKIFIAEDDPLMLRMYERIFKFSGYEVTSASNGEDALSMLRAWTDTSPLVVLLDVMMPKVSGFEVLRALKADERLKDLPVIMLTNLAGREDAEKALGLGALSYLVKSQYSPKEVVAKIEEIFSAQPTSGTPGEGGAAPAAGA